MNMQDMVGVNCDCGKRADRTEDHQHGPSEILVPDDDDGPMVSVSNTHAGDESSKELSCCTDCGTKLEWKLRLSGVTVRACPNC